MQCADDRERFLGPTTIRFCPLCGGSLKRASVPPDHREQAVCRALRLRLLPEPQGRGRHHPRAGRPRAADPPLDQSRPRPVDVSRRVRGLRRERDRRRRPRDAGGDRAGGGAHRAAQRLLVPGLAGDRRLPGARDGRHASRRAPRTIAWSGGRPPRSRGTRWPSTRRARPCASGWPPAASPRAAERPGVQLRFVDSAQERGRFDRDPVPADGGCHEISARSPSGVTDTMRPSGSAPDSYSRSVTSSPRWNRSSMTILLASDRATTIASDRRSRWHRSLASIALPRPGRSAEPAIRRSSTEGTMTG